MTDLSTLASASDVWNFWRFEPWAKYGMSGLYRRVTFVKAGLMGEVARYYADDYVIWSYEDDALEVIRRNFGPQKDLMTQRVVLVTPDDNFKKKVYAFLLGFRGYLEIYRYSPFGEGYRKIKDLTPLIDKAWEISELSHQEGGEVAENVME